MHSTRRIEVDRCHDDGKSPGESVDVCSCSNSGQNVASLRLVAMPPITEVGATIRSPCLRERVLMLKGPPAGGPSSLLRWRLLFYVGLLRLLLVAPIPTPITPIHACKARG